MLNSYRMRLCVAKNSIADGQGRDTVPVTDPFMDEEGLALILVVRNKLALARVLTKKHDMLTR